MRVLILFISLITIVSCNKEQELTLLDRCIEANMPELNETEREDIIDEILDSYEVVFPDETSKKQFELLQSEDGMIGVGATTVFYLSLQHNFYDSDHLVLDNDFGINDYVKLIKNLNNVYDYNIEYYGLRDGGEGEAEYKKTATRVCNMQGIY